MFCSKCGKENNEKSKFCVGCGDEITKEIIAVADGTKGTSGAPSQSGNVTPPTQSNNNSNNASKPEASKPEASKPGHEHSWTQNYRTEEYVVSEAWTENIMGTRDVYGTVPVYENVPVYTEYYATICNVCGADITGNVVPHQEDHVNNGGLSGYHSKPMKKQTGTESKWVRDDSVVTGQEQYVASTVNHPAVMGTRQVPNGYTCSCGATK